MARSLVRNSWCAEGRPTIVVMHYVPPTECSHATPRCTGLGVTFRARTDQLRWTRPIPSSEGRRSETERAGRPQWRVS